MSVLLQERKYGGVVSRGVVLVHHVRCSRNHNPFGLRHQLFKPLPTSPY
jgi:hypothetical protein